MIKHNGTDSVHDKVQHLKYHCKTEGKKTVIAEVHNGGDVSKRLVKFLIIELYMFLDSH